MNIIFVADSIDKENFGLNADDENLFISEDYKRFLSHMHYSEVGILISVLNTYPNNISNYFSFEVNSFIQRLKDLGIYDEQKVPPRTFGVIR